MKGRKRHALVDTDGRLFTVIVHPADVQDRDGAVPLLKASRRSFPFIVLAFVDAAYAGERVANATCITVQIVRKADDQIGFKVHKRRLVVERLFAWLGGNRRLSRDVERLVASVQAFFYAASCVPLGAAAGRRPAGDPCCDGLDRFRP